MKTKKETKIKFYKQIQVEKILLKILYAIILICILYNILFLINTTISHKDYFSLFGISIFVMENDLMEDEISKNALIITNDDELDTNDLEIDDTIVYEKNSKIKIAKIISVQANDGKTQYIVKAIKNYYPDNEPVVIGQIIGKVQLNIPVLGVFIKILQSKITTSIIIILLILKLLYNRYTYKMKIERKKKKIKKSMIGKHPMEVIKCKKY